MRLRRTEVKISMILNLMFPYGMGLRVSRNPTEKMSVRWWKFISLLGFWVHTDCINSFIFDSPYQSWLSAIPDFIISLYQIDIYLQIKVFCCISLSYQEWWLCFLQVELTKTRLQAALLVKAPETGELFVNFDPQILTLIRETDCMAHMCLDIPPFASAIQQKRDWYKNIVHNLQVGSF